MLSRFTGVAKMTDSTPLQKSNHSKLNGFKNQSLTKPISLDESTGEILVRKATGKTKIRKGQSEEEYQRQLCQYVQVEKGPKKSEIGWMDEVDPLDLIRNDEESIKIKLTRQKLSNFCQRMYYQKKYKDCAELCTVLLQRYQSINKKNKIQREIQELEYMIQRSRQMAE